MALVCEPSVMRRYGVAELRGEAGFIVGRNPYACPQIGLQPELELQPILKKFYFI